MAGFINLTHTNNAKFNEYVKKSELTTLTQEELQTLMNGVLFPPPDAYKLKIYNQENVTKNYNPAWEGYAFVEMGEFPQGTDPRDEENPEPVIATGETFTFGGNTFEIWQSDLDESRRFATIGNDWFIFEPLRWLIIATSSDLTDTATYGLGANNHTDMPESGEKVLLLSEFALYRDYFDLDSPYTNKFSSDDCDLQVNMNGGFAEMSGLAKYFGSYIPITEYGTTWNDGTSEQFDVSSSNMFALGYTNGNDANVDTFSILEYMTSGSEQMQVIPTEFAVKTGVSLNANSNSSPWWLRSGYYLSYGDDYYTYYVLSIGYDNSNTVHNGYGVRPSFILNLGGEND